MIRTKGVVAALAVLALGASLRALPATAKSKCPSSCIQALKTTKSACLASCKGLKGADKKTCKKAVAHGWTTGVSGCAKAFGDSKKKCKTAAPTPPKCSPSGAFIDPLLS